MNDADLVVVFSLMYCRSISGRAAARETLLGCKGWHACVCFLCNKLDLCIHLIPKKTGVFQPVVCLFKKDTSVKPGQRNVGSSFRLKAPRPVALHTYSPIYTLHRSHAETRTTCCCKSAVCYSHAQSLLSHRHHVTRAASCVCCSSVLFNKH